MYLHVRKIGAEYECIYNGRSMLLMTDDFSQAVRAFPEAKIPEINVSARSEYVPGNAHILVRACGKLALAHSVVNKIESFSIGKSEYVAHCARCADARAATARAKADANAQTDALNRARVEFAERYTRLQHANDNLILGVVFLVVVILAFICM